MPLIQPYRGILPVVAPDVFVAENATLIGDVQVGEGSSIWYQAVLRGDVDAIRIGRETNLQDAVIVHCTTGRCPTMVGDRVIVGHRAILHGCTIGDEVLIGMGAIVLDEAVVPMHTIVAAGSLVPERMVLESGFLYAGVPVRKIKQLSPSQVESIRLGALHYVEKAREYRETGAPGPQK
jgi:carbonic anhydrase/acetyltransferase-like protein (isoleucine patch superfamily)